MPGITELHNAVRRGDYEVVEKLILSGVDVNATSHLTIEDRQLLSESNKATIKISVVPPFTGVTALHLACIYNKPKCFSLLAEAGANFKARLDNGLTLIAMLCGSKGSKDKLILDLVMEGCADLAFESVRGLRIGASSFGAASYFQGMSEPGESKRRPSKIHFSESDCKSVDKLIIAITRRQSISVLAKFINKKTHLKDERGSALYQALASGQYESALFLIESGCLVQNKHFFAAAQAIHKSLSAEKSLKLYNKLRENFSLTSPDFFSDKAHKILGVTQEMPVETIKLVYKRLILQYHPDKRSGDLNARYKFQNIQLAYKYILSQSVSFTLETLKFVDLSKHKQSVDALVRDISDGDIESVNLHLKENIHLQDDKGNALFIALKLNRKDMTLLLLQNGYRPGPRHFYAMGLDKKPDEVIALYNFVKKFLSNHIPEARASSASRPGFS